MSGPAPANPLRLSLPSSDRVKPETDRVSVKPTSAERVSNLQPARAKITEPPSTDPYVRWCEKFYVKPNCTVRFVRLKISIPQAIRPETDGSHNLDLFLTQSATRRTERLRCLSSACIRVTS
jgi:hypothetical protein